MTDRLPSGSEHLDAVLGGGLLLNGITLLIGKPGSGKTILAQQYVFHNATVDRPALYVSTVSEPLEKILRYGQSLEYFDAAALGSSVIYENVGQQLSDHGLAGVLERVNELLLERRPALIVIDSFKALQAFASDAGTYRRFLHELAGRLSAMPVTSFWVGEYAGDEMSDAPEFAVCDAILALSTQQEAERETRTLQVLKIRGSDSLSGKHSYRLSPKGFEIFPRLADPIDRSDYDEEVERISSGVAAIDGMLGNGFWRGSSTLLAGPSGIGKTLLASHFIFAGAERGEAGVVATFQENPVQLKRFLRGFSWSIDDAKIEVMYRPPVDLYLDEWVYDLLRTVERTGAQRVAIDSLGDLQAASRDELRFREYIYSLLQRFARRGVSVIMTQEVPELFGVRHLSQYGVSHLSDNVLLLQFLRGDSELKRAITVLKTRGSGHTQELRQFDITPEGVVVGSRFEPDQSLH